MLILSISLSLSLPPSFFELLLIIAFYSMQGKCMFEYLPLKVGESTAKLSLQSSDLGVYQYELHLVATPPPPERVYHFTTHLGSSHQQHCSFVSYAKGRTEYTCKVRFLTNLSLIVFNPLTTNDGYTHHWSLKG